MGFGMKFRSLDVNLPFGIGALTIELTTDDQKVAWELYVEYATRIATQTLAVGTGSVREALNSLHSLFGATRTILRNSDPSIARNSKAIGPLAIEILNVGLRPFLTEWHTKLSTFERQAAAANMPPEESQWPEREAFHARLEETQRSLNVYTRFLADAAGVTGERV